MRRRLRELRDTVFAYTPSGGTPEYVATVQAYYEGLGIPLGLEDIIATTGGSEALLFAFLGLRERGRRGAGRRAVLYELLRLRDDGRRASGAPDQPRRGRLPSARRARHGRRRSPSARAWSSSATRATRRARSTVAEELRMVADFCREHGLFLVADEVYREFVYDGAKAVSALTLAGGEDFVVVVDSQSKRYSACGIRLGCLISRNREVTQAAMKMAQGRLSAPGLAQVVALGARELGPDYTAGRGHGVPAPPRRALRGPVPDPRRVPAQAGGRVLLRGPPARRRRGAVRALAPDRLRAARGHGHGGTRGGLLRDAGTRPRRGPDRLRPQGGRPAGRRRHPGRGPARLPRGARDGGGFRGSEGVRQPDFSVPAES